MRYIAMHPVWEGMVELSQDYKWSSYLTNALDVHDNLVSLHDSYLGLLKKYKTKEAIKNSTFE